MTKLTLAEPGDMFLIETIANANRSKMYRPPNRKDIVKAIKASTAFTIRIKPHGYAGFLIHQNRSDGILLDEFAVHPTLWGNGAGSSALTQWLTLPEVAGRKVRLLTHPRNPAAALYERHGFIKTGEVVANHYGDGEPRMWMERAV